MEMLDSRAVNIPSSTNSNSNVGELSEKDISLVMYNNCLMFPVKIVKGNYLLLQTLFTS
jgi:hypothetical protein